MKLDHLLGIQFTLRFRLWVFVPTAENHFRWSRSVRSAIGVNKNSKSKTKRRKYTLVVVNGDEKDRENGEEVALVLQVEAALVLVNGEEEAR
nr:hypothetical protein Iba_chr13aCG9200 [Ipomoea batatas]